MKFDFIFYAFHDHKGGITTNCYKMVASHLMGL